MPEKPLSELDQLHRLGDRKFSTRGSGSVSNSNKIPHYSIANSHKLNDKYMQDWDEAYADMQRKAGVSSRQIEPPRQTSGTNAPRTSLRELANSNSTQSGSSIFDNMYGYTPLSNQWMAGPINSEGHLIDVSPNAALLGMSMSRSGKEIIVGSVDHSAYNINLQTKRQTRQYFEKQYGHREWVHCSVFFPDTRVATGGFEGKICIWDVKPINRSSKCKEIDAHFGGVTNILVPGGGNQNCGPSSNTFGHLMLSAGYDKIVKLWDLRDYSCVMKSQSHGAPVISMAITASDIHNTFWGATGDRDGNISLWELYNQGLTAQLKGHRGHLTALGWGGPLKSQSDVYESGITENLLFSGAQDGHVRVWDIRDRHSVANLPAHVAPDGGSGAISDLVVTGVPSGDGSIEQLLVTTGADKRATVLDPRKGWATRYVLDKQNDFISTLSCRGGYAHIGLVNGAIYSYDLRSGRALYGLGAGQGEIRSIALNNSQMAAISNAGTVMIYDF